MIRVGAIGCGRWGPNHIRNINMSGRAQVVRCADQELDRLKEMERLFPGVETTQDATALARASDLDAVLSQHRIEDNVVIQLGSFGALPLLLDSTDLVAVVPKQYARQLEAAGQARLLPIEFSSQHASVQLVWSEKTENEPGSAWLREIVSSLFSEVRAKA